MMAPVSIPPRPEGALAPPPVAAERKLSLAVHPPHLFLDRRHHPAFRQVDRSRADAQLRGHRLAALALDGRPPERLPGGRGEPPADLAGRPVEQPPLALAVPGRGRVVAG